jgi:glutamate synthase (ferredoxin)
MDRLSLDEMARRIAEHPGRGGCGVGAVADLSGVPSHELIDLAIQGLGCLEHRGGSIEDTGDGAGLLLSIDRVFFERFFAPGRRLPAEHHLAVGVLFFPPGETQNLPHWQHEIDAILRQHGLAPLGWRRAPVDETVLGRQARESRRDVWQVLIGEGMVPLEDLRLTLWRVKSVLERQVRDLYVASFSPDTLVYKALATGTQLRGFYADLRNPALRTSVAVFHRRYSTNTFSNWYLAQVFRLLCHNGEINTIKANRNGVRNLEAELGLGPILMSQGSDSADMDRVVELFVSHGISLLETLNRMMPMAWRDLPRLPPEAVRWFQGVQRALGSLGAWEGPAAIVATDGRYLVGALDRMGLRPLRYLVTRSGKVVIGSEIGAIPIDFEDVLETGQLDPGESFAVHLGEGRILRASEILARVVAETPINFAELAEHRLIGLPRGPAAPAGKSAVKPDGSALGLFGWTAERLRRVKYMAENGKEAITSMGYDRPLPAMSALRPPLTKYFKQIVAVVTNPPIDPIREGGAFDLTVHLGPAPSVHENTPIWDPRPQYKLASPVLTEQQFLSIRDAASEDRPKALVLDCTFEDPGVGPTAGAKAISRRIAEICRAALAAVKKGETSILILSDRAALRALAEQAAPRSPCLPLPMVLMASALHNTLVSEGRRRHGAIVVETGEVQEGHDLAVFLANGATAVHPYLYFQVGLMHGTVENLCAGLDETLKRIMSKMGICSVDGYRGSRLFEAVGIAPSVVDHYLPGVTSRLGGLELEDLYEDICERRVSSGKPLPEPDLSIYRKEVWNELQTTARGHDPDSYRRFLKLIDETPPVYLRDLLRLREAPSPRPLEEVAAEEEIVAAVFRGAAMSHGALHGVAHRAIAAAFNHFGAMSNCGEGGEDPRRDRGGPWEVSRSRIRQVASGRFGVDARYLVHADELSIKIGQGAKPGEGGMLPGAKVTAEVAAIRRTQVGVTLISPPPQHDIYSIEDLAQLIYNLKQANPYARVSVKIPAVTDIGTIAVGIAKAGADVIDVSGFEGGTGAAVSSSIEHAGLPLERALSETHQALVLSGVRGRVRLRADGGIKTAFDVAVILAIGADEVSLGTALMIAEQCIYCHGCHNGLCPAGITTQSELVARRLMTVKKGRPKDEELPDVEEERYEDAKNAVIRLLRALAGDLRRRLAALGLVHPAQLTGRVDLLERRPPPRDPTGMDLRRAKIDVAELLLDVREALREPAMTHAAVKLPADPTSPLNARICRDAAAAASASGSAGTELRYPVTNRDRAVGATLAGKIAIGEIVPPPGGFTIRLHGYVGQALGFACTGGLRIELDGFANDTVGEAMGGGTIVVRPPREVPPEERGALSVAGNAACYGATGGRLFVEGRAGQRVGVRNSGAAIVVEGAGKYAFEYMTGGVGVVLGTVGSVLGSGFTGGAIYVLDQEHLAERVHKDAVLGPLGPEDEAVLRGLLEEHVRETGSTRAARLLREGAAFHKLTPRDAGPKAQVWTAQTVQMPADPVLAQTLQGSASPR